VEKGIGESMVDKKWIAYVAGPYRDETIYGKIRNIRHAEEISLMLWSYGFVAICPHKNAEHFEGAYDMDDQVFLDGDIEILKRCDFMVVVPGWRTSPGTQREIGVANAHRIPVLYWENETDRTVLRNYYREDRGHG
jgi:nucleoside 2-deoxyribosyltransferase